MLLSRPTISPSWGTVISHSFVAFACAVFLSELHGQGPAVVILGIPVLLFGGSVAYQATRLMQLRQRGTEGVGVVTMAIDLGVDHFDEMLSHSVGWRNRVDRALGHPKMWERVGRPARGVLFVRLEVGGTKTRLQFAIPAAVVEQMPEGRKSGCATSPTLRTSRCSSRPDRRSARRS